MKAKVRCNSIKLKRVSKTIVFHVWDHTKEVWDGKIKLCIDAKVDPFKVDKIYEITFKKTNSNG